MGLDGTFRGSGVKNQIVGETEPTAAACIVPDMGHLNA